VKLTAQLRQVPRLILGAVLCTCFSVAGVFPCIRRVRGQGFTYQPLGSFVTASGLGQCTNMSTYVIKLYINLVPV
jgi:hypothetical protein